MCVHVYGVCVCREEWWGKGEGQAGRHGEGEGKEEQKMLEGRKEGIKRRNNVRRERER